MLHLVNDIMDKIRNSHNYQTLYSLEEEFNKIGLTLQRTEQNWIILCRIDESRPKAKKVLEDYIFLSTLDNKSGDITEQTIRCLVEFIKRTASKPAAVVDPNPGRNWRSAHGLYGGAIPIVNEGVDRITQFAE